VQIISFGSTVTIEQKEPLPAKRFVGHGAMIEAQTKIRVNLRSSAVRFSSFFVFFLDRQSLGDVGCGYSLTYPYED